MRLKSYEDFVQVDADGRIVSTTEYDVGAYFDLLRGQSVSATAELETHPQVTLPGSLDGELGDRIAVNLTAGQTYTFAYRGTPTGGVVDPYLQLIGTDGTTVITSDDDGGYGRSSMITYTAAATGTYYVNATSWYHVDPTAPGYPDTRDTGSYEFSMWSPDPAHDAGSTLGTAVAIGAGTTFGNIATAADADIYKLSVTEGMVYSFAYSGGVISGADYASGGGSIAYLELYDANGVSIGSNLNYESSLTFFAENSADIYVRVRSYSGTTGGYTLDVDQVDPSTRDPLESLNWDSANNVPFVDTNGDGRGDTAYVYFAPAGENFGEKEPDGTTPMTTYGWTDWQIEGVMNALKQYESILGVKYVITSDVEQATFRMLTTQNQAYGARFYPQDPAYGEQAGIGTFNLASGGFGTRPESLVQGGFSYAVVLHEFGHAHGIAHPHDNGGGSEIMLGVTGSTGSYGVYNLNQGVYTVMSYNDAWDFHPDGPTTEASNGSIGAVIDHGWSGSLGAFDIALLQERYGVVERNTGNNTYTLNDDYKTAFYQTIWDSAGMDTISYGGDLDAQIDLTAATLDYTPTGGGVLSFLHNDPQPDYTTEVKGGYTIANGVVIENATGGSGNDVLLGNSANNTLTGNAGNDVMEGRGGRDILRGGNGDDVLNGGLGKDDLYGGSGADRFVFDTLDGIIDKVKDFDSGSDRIDLSAFEGVDSADVKITNDAIFVNTDGVKGYEVQIVIEGERALMTDIIFA